MLSALTVTPLYAGLLAVLFLALSMGAIAARRRARLALGTGDNPALLRAIRVHGNFAEYVPLALLLLLLLEIQGLPGPFLHALGLALLLARLVHAMGVARANENFRYRVAGMVLTLIMNGAAALANLALAALR